MRILFIIFIAVFTFPLALVLVGLVYGAGGGDLPSAGAIALYLFVVIAFYRKLVRWDENNMRED